MVEHSYMVLRITLQREHYDKEKKITTNMHSHTCIHTQKTIFFTSMMKSEWIGNEVRAENFGKTFKSLITKE